MHTETTSNRFLINALALICLLPALAFGQGKEYVPPQPSDGPGFSLQAQSTGKPSVNNEIFKTLKAQCETDVASGKANGDVCADAAAILIGNDPPDDLRNLPETVRIKISLRMLERGLDSSNLAAGRAYDLYSKGDLFLGVTTAGYSDPYRANELMELMVKRSYVGATLRKAKTTVSFLSLTISEADKKQTCAQVEKLKAGGKLDVDSTRIANEVLDAVVCRAPATPPPAPNAM